jgi:hypothetical protein
VVAPVTRKPVVTQAPVEEPPVTETTKRPTKEGDPDPTTKPTKKNGGGSSSTNSASNGTPAASGATNTSGN